MSKLGQLKSTVNKLIINPGLLCYRVEEKLLLEAVKAYLKHIMGVFTDSFNIKFEVSEDLDEGELLYLSLLNTDEKVHDEFWDYVEERFGDTEIYDFTRFVFREMLSVPTVYDIRCYYVSEGKDIVQIELVRVA